MNNERRLSYIASGTSYLRMHSSSVLDNPVLSGEIDSIFSQIENRSSHEFGLLYNAFVEKNFGPGFTHFPSVKSIFSDSGGLQLITLGKQITPALMDDIFRNQAQYSDMAMCFDMIPVSTTGATSGRNDVSNRFFDINNLESAARETGRNITRQIEVFQEMKSKAKPILIAQGNCYETYMKWTDYIMDEIPKDMHQYIGGVAMGGAALGTGSLEDVERAFIFTQLQVEKTHLHVLGVGAVKRMLPYIAFIKNGMYDGVSVSYDSTTHTSGTELGNYFHNGGMLSFNRNFSESYNIMHRESQEISGVDIDAKEFFRILNVGRTAYGESGGDNGTFIKVRISTIINSITNFCREIDGLLSSDKKFLQRTSRDKALQPIQALLDVKDLASYNKWKNTCGRYVKTNRIASSQPTTLEDLFA